MVYTVGGVQYTRRKKIPVTGAASGAQTNFQIKLAAVWAAAMQADFDDVRFTKADMQTLIDTWLESKVDSTSANIWAEFPTTPADGVVKTEAYMYFGNAGAASYWNGINTFVKYADKDDYSTHFSSNGASVSGDYIRVGVADTDSWGTNYLVAISALDRTAQGYSATFKLKGTGTSANEDETMFGFATDNALTQPQCDFYYGASTTLNAYENTSQIGIDAITWTNDIVYEMLYPQNIGVEYLVDGVSKRTNAAYASDPGKVRITPYSGPVDVKYIFTRKYVSGPPTAAFGTEEHQRRTPMMM